MVSEASDRSAAGGSPLTAEHREQLRAANERLKRVRWPALVAAFNGWSYIVLGLLALPLGLVDRPILVGGAAVVMLGVIEVWAGRRARGLDPAGLKVLGWNELAVAGLIVGYCGWRVGVALTGSSELQRELARHPGLGAGELGVDVGQLYSTIAVVIYIGIAVGALLYQGLCAVYFFARVRTVRRYLRQTPGWIVEVQRAT